ncbi:MAG: type II secretion system F family protein [Micrococcales bacterium]|nr:type II secretion system F family protein [Micrococcales bacterium]
MPAEFPAPAVLAAVLSATAVLLWPARPRLGPRRDAPPQARSGAWAALAGLVRLRRASRRSSEAGEVADLAEALAPCLAAGLPPSQALAIAAESAPASLTALVGRLEAAAATGAALGPVWCSDEGEHCGLIGRAWTLSDRLGSPLAGAVATAGSVLRAQEADGRRVDAAASGPRASMWLLTLLPAVGPGVGWLLGMSPGELYGSSAAAPVCLAAGIVLTLAGWWWSRRLLARALRPEEVR